MRLTDYFNQGDSADEAVSDRIAIDTHLPFSTTDPMPLLTDGGEESNSAASPDALQQGLPPSVHSHKPNSLKRGSSTQPSEAASTATLASVSMETRQAATHSSNASPTKHRTKLHTTVDVELSAPAMPNDELVLFPATDQAVSQAILKEMMLALRSYIHQSFTTALSSQQSTIDGLGDRVDHVETKMAEFSTAHNELVDAHNNLEDELHSMATKLADIEDRNHRNNIKIRGIPESVSGPELICIYSKLWYLYSNWPPKET